MDGSRHCARSHCPVLSEKLLIELKVNFFWRVCVYCVCSSSHIVVHRLRLVLCWNIRVLAPSVPSSWIGPSHVPPLVSTASIQRWKTNKKRLFFWLRIWLEHCPRFFVLVIFSCVRVFLFLSPPFFGVLLFCVRLRMGCRWRWRAFTSRLRLPDQVLAKWKPRSARLATIRHLLRHWPLSPSTMYTISSSSSCPALAAGTTAAATTLFLPTVRLATSTSSHRRPKAAKAVAAGSSLIATTITTTTSTTTLTCTRSLSTICTSTLRRSVKSSPLPCL